MPTELHDISVAIGQLRADVEHARRSREVTHQRIEDLGRRMDGLSRQLEELAMSVRDVAALTPEVRHYADARRRIAGGVTVLIFLAGGIGALMAELVKLVRQ